MENAIKYEKGVENHISKKGMGALHIEKHLDPKNNGYVTREELLKMGDIVRSVEPYERDGKRVYETTDKNGVRFRVIIGNGKKGDRIISFYSDRRGGIENNILTYNYSNPSVERSDNSSRAKTRQLIEKQLSKMAADKVLLLMTFPLYQKGKIFNP